MGFEAESKNNLTVRIITA